MAQTTDRLMSPAEVATYFGVTAKTITRYVEQGRLEVARYTPGGHARFWESDIHAAAQAVAARKRNGDAR